MPASPRTNDSSQQAAGRSYFAPLASAKYMLLTTFKRDGTTVPTPVHVVVDGDSAYFRTWEPSGKCTRLRHNQRVQVAPCTMRGRGGTPTLDATARQLASEEASQAARALARKYPIQHGLLIPWVHRMRGWRTVQYEIRANAHPELKVGGQARTRLAATRIPGTFPAVLPPGWVRVRNHPLPTMASARLGSSPVERTRRPNTRPAPWSRWRVFRA